MFVPTPPTAGGSPGHKRGGRVAAVYRHANNPVLIDAVANLTMDNLNTMLDKLQAKGVLERTQAGWAPYKPEDYAYPASPY